MTQPVQWYFDLSEPLPPQCCYRVRLISASKLPLALKLYMVPAINLTGAMGNSLRIYYINQFGPTDAW
jgi:hypothetical protein